MTLLLSFQDSSKKGNFGGVEVPHDIKLSLKNRPWKIGIIGTVRLHELRTV